MTASFVGIRRLLYHLSGVNKALMPVSHEGPCKFLWGQIRSENNDF